MNRPSSLPSDYFSRPQKPDVSAVVLSVSDAGTVDVQLGSGEILRRVDLAGAAIAGDSVMLRYDEHGKYTALGSRPSSANSGAAYVIASGSSGGGTGTIPDPHDLLGSHHALPVLSQNVFLASPTTSSGTPSFRALSTSDIPSMSVSAGTGLTGGGTLPAGITLNVGQGSGITVDTSNVSVRRATTSGLSFDSSYALQVDDSIAGAGLGISGKVMSLADGVAGAGLSINSTTKAISVSAGNGISVASSPSAVAINLAATSGLNTTSGLAVGAGNGVSVLTDTVAVRRATTSGLSFSGGGLAVGAGNGVSVLTDTVAVDQSYAFAWTAAHTFSARPTFSAGATVSAGQTMRFGADVDLQRGGTNVLTLGTGDAMRSSSYQSGVSGWGVSDAGDAEFNNVRVRGELATTVFRFNEISATAGTLGVYMSASVVHADFTTPSAISGTVSGVQIKNSTPSAAVALFAAGDRLQVRVWNGTALVNAWFTVGASPTVSTGYTTYTLTLASGSTSALVGAGTAIVDHGTATAGAAITLTADGSIGSAPNISLVTNTGSPWTTNTLRMRVGNLRNSYDYGATDIYGFATGDNATAFASVDSTNGFRVVRSSVARFQVDASGNLSLNNSSGNAVISMDTGGNASIAGVLNVGTSGGIYQGTGTFASPTTGLKIWNSSGVGLIAGYNSTVVQWQAGTDGRLYAGGGDVVLSSTGVSVAFNSGTRGTGWNLENGYRFTAAATTTFLGLYDAANDTLQHTLYLLNVGSYGSRVVSISGESTSAAYPTVGVDLKAVNTTGTTTLSVRKDTVSVDAASLSVDYGLNVGSATGATAGQVKASAGISGTTGSFSSTVSGTSGTFTTGINVGSATGAAAGAIKASGDVSANDGVFTGGLNVGTTLGVTGATTLSSTLGVTGAATFSGGISVGTTGAGAGNIKLSGDVSANDAAFTGGLNVGSATGALTGAIKASAGISGTTGSFSSTVSGTSGTFTTGINVGSATGAAAGAIKASGDVSANDAAFTGGINVGSATGANAGSVKYTGYLTANRNSQDMDGCIYVPNTAYTNLTDTGSTAWSGAATRAVGNYQINLSATANGLNAAIKAVVLAVRGSWTTASASNRLNIREWTGTGTGGTNQIIVTAQAANIPIDNVGVVNVGASSSITVEVAGASVSNGLIRVIGYYI